jgi:hypothetical protein
MQMFVKKPENFKILLLRFVEFTLSRENLFCFINFSGCAMPQTAKIDAALLQLELTYPQFATMTAEALRMHWRAMIKKSHPDLPENRLKNIDPAAINAAYDLLKLAQADRARLAQADPLAPQPTSYATSYDRTSIAPPWQPDKHTKNHRIHVESYRDQNFIKKRIWELSNQSDEIYTIDAFGKTSFEGRTRVYGSQDVFDEMAKAMLVWNANGGNIQLTRAVLVSSPKQENSVYLIYADGKSLADNPIPLKYNPKAGSHYDDKTFQANLPRILDHIHEMLASEQVARAG